MYRIEGAKRYVKAVICTTLASRAASYIFRTSCWFRPRGFSQRTCLPAFAAAVAIGKWVKLGVAMTTASMPSSAQSTSGSVLVLLMPHSFARSSSSLESASQTATSSALGSSRIAGTW